jgi:hypothetical protein
MYILEEADYRNEKICVVRKNVCVSTDIKKLQELAEKMKLSAPDLVYTIWQIKEI